MDNLQRQNLPLSLTPEDKRNLIGFFELLIKVDKRVNPNLYTSKPEKFLIKSNPLLWENTVAM